MRRLILGLIAFCIFQSVSAQQSTVKGKIIDTLEHMTLSNAVISLIKKSDSTLYKFTRTDRNGDFNITNVETGKYLLLITYPKFADFSDEVEVNGQPINDLGSIALTLKSQLLQAVIIKTNNAIRIKGDTTEFVADSFHVKDGATVEDLLKKLPGFQVNAKGEITAQGQKVQKVLVDGEEFFGNDPTMATQNISAKAVDKVQVFDSKSEQQQLTGITNNDDGKTLNIKLKEDKKKGSFGKAYAGTDFHKYYDAKGLYNNFVGKKKISFYATKSNVNAGSLDWQDRQKLGLEDDMEYDDINGYYYSFGSSDEFSDWNLRGIPNSTTGGALFSNKWNEDKKGINGSYRYNRLQTTNNASTLTQNILQNTVNYRNKYSNSEVINQQHAINGKYEWKIDSLATLKFSTADLYKTSDLFGHNNSEYLNSLKEYVNTSDQTEENHTKRLQTDNQLTYKQLFKKKDRLWLTTFRFGVTQDDQNGILRTQTNFFKDNTLDSIDLLDQMKQFNGESLSYGIKSAFSEPLTSKLALLIDYAYNQNNSSSNLQTFNKSNAGKYELFDPLYSNDFDLKAFSNSSTAILKYTDKKLRFAAGSGLSSVVLRLINNDFNTKNDYHFLNLTPQAQIGYIFKPQTNLSFTYRGSTVQPNINQLQPIRNNNDPLNVFIGNPNLKVGFDHNLRVFFNQFKVLSGRGLWLSANYNIHDNAITNYNILDTGTGKQTYTPVNVNGNRNWNFWSNWFKGQGEKKLNFGIQLNGNGGRNINFTNGQKNITDYSSVHIGISLNYDHPDKLNFYLNPELGYNTSTSSLNRDAKSNYFSYGTNFDGFVMLPGKLELNTNVNVNLQQQIDGFTQGTNIVVWNASLARKVFKDKSGKIIFSANDILDQNKGFDRTINSNFISEEHYSRISRYFLLKFEWTFNKMPGTK
jgi:hypothetical protein